MCDSLTSQYVVVMGHCGDLKCHYIRDVELHDITLVQEGHKCHLNHIYVQMKRAKG